MKKRMLRADVLLEVVCYIFLVILTLFILIPLLNLFSVSISSQESVIAGRVRLIPQDIQLEAYRMVLLSGSFYRSLLNTALVTLGGTLIGCLSTVAAAYALSRPRLPGRKIITFLFLLTMIFNGGMIPSYLLINKLGLLNSLWAVLLPTSVSAYNLLIVKSYMESLPEAIDDAARIDGATRLQTLVHVIIPTSLPVIATVGIFYAVTLWNDYLNSYLYLTKQTMFTLQLYLKSVIFDASDPMGGFSVGEDVTKRLAPQTIINATIITSILPIACVYPMLQKYFINGIMLGAVKE